jgi:hypothetical protein
VVSVTDPYGRILGFLDRTSINITIIILDICQLGLNEEVPPEDGARI